MSAIIPEGPAQKIVFYLVQGAVGIAVTVGSWLASHVAGEIDGLKKESREVSDNLGIRTARITILENDQAEAKRRLERMENKIDVLVERVRR